MTASAGVAQLVRALPCHGRGRGFESRLSRHFVALNQSFRQFLILRFDSGTPRAPTPITFLTALLFRTAGVLIALLLGAASIAPARAQAPYPNRPIRIVVPFGPGGFADITVRLLAQKLAERTRAQVVIENRPGAGGITAGSVVTAAEPDGYTLFVFSSGIALSKSLLKSMPFDPLTAFAPISTMAQFDLLLLVRADSPIHTLKDALDAARADPRKFNVGTISPGSTQNVTGELLRSTSGVPMTVVPHRTSAEVLTALLRGDIQIGIETYAAMKAPIDAGQIRAVASSGSNRSPLQPEVPTLRESGIDAAVDGWNSLVAPAGTPRPIVGFLSGQVRAIIADPDFRKRLIDLGGEPMASSPEELDARLKSDAEMWAAVVKKAGLEPN
jgi:tripartite-type tricarboxylate transporter receptor subunit TctC